MNPKRVGILASGGGSNAEALMKAAAEPGFPAKVVLLFSDKKDAPAIAKAAARGVAVAHFSPKAYASREDFDQALLKLLQEKGVEILCLAGYMRILSPVLIQAYAGRLLNIHPSLLPLFGGQGMFGHHVHEAVLRAGQSESGATVHLVEQEVDSGPILMQAKVPVLEGDTAQSLAARVLEQEHLIYPQALRMLCEKK